MTSVFAESDPHPPAPAGIEAVIAEADDRKRTRARKGGGDSLPVCLEEEKCKGRNVVERPFGNDEALAGAGHPLRQPHPHLRDMRDWGNQRSHAAKTSASRMKASAMFAQLVGKFW